jgi:glyoxylase-like metal-dependent hydrolase (beta-lactamase superfamily II)
MWISEEQSKVEELKVEESKTSSTAGPASGASLGVLPASGRLSGFLTFRSCLSPFDLPSGFALLLAAYCLLPSAYSLFAASGLYQLREIKPNVFVWIADDVIDQDGDPEFARAGNAGFSITPEGVVVVDTTNSPFHARELLYEIRQRTDMPVKYVINTSAAGDAMLGNEVFVDQQATLISTSAAQAQMSRYQQEMARRMQDEEAGWRLQARMRGFHVTPTTQTFASRMTLQPGGQEINLLSLLQSGEAAVFLPGSRIVFLGSLYQNQYFPYVDSRDVRRWIETLRQVETWDADTYVPAHGEPGSKKDLAEFRGFLEWLMAQVQGRIKQGKSLAQVKKELQLPETFHWHAPDVAPDAVEAVYKQLMEAPSAAAGSSKSPGSAHPNPPALP